MKLRIYMNSITPKFPNMKYIKKLSSKLLLVLGVIVLGIIVWQVIVSKRVIGDAKKLKQVQSIEQIQELLKNKGLKTYNAVSHHSFSKIKLNGVNAYILKGNEYAVYVSDYIRRHLEVTINKDELFLHLQSLNGFPVNSFFETPVLIFMPEDPQLVYYAKQENSLISLHKIYGFRGENTLLSGEGSNVCIYTDMPYINVNQQDNFLILFTSSLDSTLRLSHVQINVNAENSKFDLNDQISDSTNVNIQLQESFIGQITINPNSRVGTLRLIGSLRNEDNQSMNINYPGQADSLIIQLKNHSEITRYFLDLSKGLSGRFESIDLEYPHNILIERDK